MQANLRSRLGMLLLLGLLSSPAIAEIWNQDSEGFIPGVTAQGNLSVLLGGQGSGKTYYDTFSGVLVQTATATVTNNSGARARFTDVGYPIRDPWQNTVRIATSDEILVQAPTTSGGIRSRNAKAGLVAVYNPNAD